MVRDAASRLIMSTNLVFVSLLIAHGISRLYELLIVCRPFRTLLKLRVVMVLY